MDSSTRVQTSVGVVPVSEIRETTSLLPSGTSVVGESLDRLGLLHHNRRRETVGLGLMALSALGFSAMSLFVKWSGATFPTLEIVFARSIWQLTLALLWCLYLRQNPLGPARMRGWLLLRGTSGTLGLACFFYGLTHLPLADATVIFFTGPVFTAILAHVALNETFTRVDKIASGLCLLGIVLVAKPSFIFGIGHAADDLLFGRLLAVCLTLLGAALSAVGYVIVRKVGGQVHFLTHVIYFGGLSTVFAAVGMLSGGPGAFVWPRGLEEYGLLTAVGMAAFVGQVFLNKGLQLCRAGPATLMRNLDVVFAFIFGITIFHEIPDVLSITGALIIVTCTVGMGLKKWLN
ncbi:hypothetical protein H4R33_004234 [Dimargaris cristalligena]|uniref:EamA domain-containing protein n=1 Tax=Dimargaris cristalligena TaxID=215637 RepID=A0A4P9ZZL5_9FUNG|nr:hypothetical protein H4R33_004234 [Dimargaris cristalligena]RKP38392.1 hypothetical protein BJ085DRAFT_20954 [Dimargaris cristalligena]|eukprot:RKP38392.1 hypothetical protein BJ085DRAFT_20954 [Dimargaris cristalligena]